MPMSNGRSPLSSASHLKRIYNRRHNSKQRQWQIRTSRLVSSTFARFRPFVPNLARGNTF